MPAEEGEFDRCFGSLIVPRLIKLTSELDGLAFLGHAERAAVVAGVTETLVDSLRRKVSRLLVVELTAAADNGTLTASTPTGRWTEFLDRASQPGFWRDLSTHYPTLLTRLDTIVSNRCAAGAELARRFGADRAALGAFLGHPVGELTAVSFGQGDTHRAGRSVARLSLQGGALIYKPRSLAVDAALDSFLKVVFEHGAPGSGGVGQRDRIRVPRVLVREGYGWSEFVEHSYCRTPEELRSYYTGIGHWLAIARLFGTTDLHAETSSPPGRGRSSSTARPCSRRGCGWRVWAWATPPIGRCNGSTRPCCCRACSRTGAASWACGAWTCPPSEPSQVSNRRCRCRRSSMRAPTGPGSSPGRYPSSRRRTCPALNRCWNATGLTSSTVSMRWPPG